MIDAWLVARTAVTLATLLSSLGLVAWRQSRALEALGELEALRASASVAAAEEVDLMRRIQFLESRVRVVPEAARRLGMHTPDASELVILPGVLP